MKRTTILALTAALAAFAATPAAAAGGGSSGGGIPSTSGPRINPQESFRDGLAALQEKDYKKAEKKFGEVLKAAPKHPEANYYMALAKIGNGKSKGAVRYLETAIEERADFIEARERLALLKIELGEPEAARQQLAAIEEQKAACATTTCDAAWSTRAEEAIARLNAALAPAPAAAAPAVEDPAAAPAGESAEDADAESGDESDADELSLFFAPREEGVAQYVAAVRLINEGRYEEAIADLYRSQAIVGPHPDILNYLGYAHRKLGKMDRAQDYYAQALKLDPDHKGANEYLGELYLEIGAVDLAKKQLARLDRICDFGCAEREDLARLIARREGALAER